MYVGCCYQYSTTPVFKVIHGWKADKKAVYHLKIDQSLKAYSNFQAILPFKSAQGFGSRCSKSAV
jgi:hypothetical protein